jgi:hypothetical protein
VTATAARDLVEPMVSGPEVPVTAGLADHAATVKQPRHGLKEAIPNSLSKADVCATDIAHGRESAIETRMQEGCGIVAKIRHGRLGQAHKVEPRQVDVDVRVNQAWHQHLPVAVNDFCVGVRSVRAGNYILDRCTHDHNIVTFDEPVGLTVEDARSAKDSGFGVTHSGFSPIGAVTCPVDCISAISGLIGCSANNPKVVDRVRRSLCSAVPASLKTGAAFTPDRCLFHSLF